MPSYRAPLDDMRFVLYDLLRIERHPALPGFEQLTPDLVDAVLDGGARICQEVFQPLNQSGDAEGCRFENGVVRTPAGFKAAFDAYVAGGWHTLGLDPAWGGQGLPAVLSMAITEMSVSANHSLSTYIGLTSAAIGAILGFGDDALKAKFVPNLVAGKWTGTMNLTEPHCGTDLRLIQTKAVPQDDGTYRITGTKIFITAGEHDLAENIIHMVLAKIPGEEQGLRAVNLFLVPKFLVDDDGGLGPRNGVVCGGIEDKMGIRGSATATLHYQDAVGYRIGGAKDGAAVDAKDGAKDGAAVDAKDGAKDGAAVDAKDGAKDGAAFDAEDGAKAGAGRGMAGMFAMMNAARLGVGLQGLALAEVAYQNAARYAKERLAGRALAGAKYPDWPADPIIVHPDVRRMLLAIRSFTEGARALAMWMAVELGQARRHPDPARRREASELAMLLTPMIKAYFTDMGLESTNLAMQCFGGHGYIKDHGMEQFVRDARILPLYEGANGVQALDLVGRRLPAGNGQAVRRYFAMVQSFLDAEGGAGEWPTLADGLNHLIGATAWLAKHGPGDRDQAGAAASDYLRLFGTVTLGYFWARMIKVADAKLADGVGDPDFLAMKRHTGRYFLDRVMPETATLAARISAGAESLMAPPEAAF